MTDSEKDPLDSLFADAEQEADKSKIAEILSGKVILYSDTAEIVFTKEWDNRNLQEKLLIYFLARKTLYLKEIIDEERINPKIVEEETKLKGNSIRPTLIKLVDDRLVRKVEEDGTKYFVPNHAIPQIHKLIVDKE